MFGDRCDVGFIDLEPSANQFRVCVIHNSSELAILPLTYNRETKVQVKHLTA